MKPLRMKSKSLRQFRAWTLWMPPLLSKQSGISAVESKPFLTSLSRASMIRSSRMTRGFRFRGTSIPQTLAALTRFLQARSFRTGAVHPILLRPIRLPGLICLFIAWLPMPWAVSGSSRLRAVKTIARHSILQKRRPEFFQSR